MGAASFFRHPGMATWDLYQKATSGAAQEELLLKSNERQIPHGLVLGWAVHCLQQNQSSEGVEAAGATAVRRSEADPVRAVRV